MTEPEKKTRAPRRSWGRVEAIKPRDKEKAKKKSNWRYRARYTYREESIKAPNTFDSKGAAEGWLAAEKRLIDLEVWTHPEERERKAEAAGTTLAEFFDTWLPMDDRRETTQATYQSMFNNRVAAHLGDRPLTEITPAEVSAWVDTMRAEHPTTKKRNADTYAMVATVFRKAISMDLVDTSPCTVEGAGRKPKSKAKRLLTTEEFTVVVEALPERYRMAVVLADHCSLRIGEWTELRRSDLVVTKPKKGTDALTTAKIHVQRSVAFSQGRTIVGPGKTEDSDRWVHVSPALAPALLDHIERFSQKERDGLLFPNKRGDYCKHTRFRDLLAETAKATIGRRISPHDFRHHGATDFARTGATIKEIMARLGHTTPDMAMRYQHASAERDQQLSAAMPVTYVPGSGQKKGTDA